jgi:hypothetical protein
MKRAAVLSLAAAALLLGACTEREQTATGIKTDTAPFHGTAYPAFRAADWKQGDRNSWEQHIKVRTVRGQNEYDKVP